MSLSLDDQFWLERLLEFADANRARLSNWERQFIDDHRQRYEEDGSEMRISPKQREWLVRIEDKLDI